MAFVFGFGSETPSILSDSEIDLGTSEASRLKSKVETFRVDERDQKKAIRWVQDWKPDVIINNGVQRAEWVGSLAKQFPMVFFPHDYYSSCISGNKFTRRPLRECHRQFGPSCLFNYYLLGCGGKNPLTLAKNYLKVRKYKKNLNFYSRLVVVSERMRAEMIREGYPDKQIDLIPYFPSNFIPLPDEPKPDDFNFNLMYIGRLVQSKGWRDAVHAVESASLILGRKLLLKIVGDGPDQIAVERVSQESNGMVQYCGKLDTLQIIRLMSKVDAILMPSRWAEPYGKVGIEAGSQGVPAIAYQVGGISEWLRDGETGLFVRNGSLDPALLAKRICDFYASSDEWNRMRRQAWRQACELSIGNHLKVFYESMYKAIETFKQKSGL